MTATSSPPLPPHDPRLGGDPRQLALNTLMALEKRGLTLEKAWADRSRAFSSLSHRDRTLARAIVFGVLRWRGKLDWIIGQLSSTPFDKLAIPIRNLLRIGLFQMMALDRVPDSAAIHSTVELTKTLNKPWLTRFVNALLRQYQRRRDDIPWPDGADSPDLAVAVKTSHPEWLVRRWMARLGPEETLAACEANNTIPAISLRANTLKTDRRRLALAVKSSADRMDTNRFLPDALSIEGLRVPIDRMVPFQSGWFQVQDEASQLISLILDPRPGDRVLDVCAGRGGKTGHLAQLMDNRGDIIAVDIDGDKLKTLDGEMVRLGVTIVRTLVEDVTTWEDGGLKNPANRVLVDAPCSGLGVIRRHPEARWDPKKRDLNRFQLRQGQLLERASRWVCPGGILVYAVCSTEPEEGIDVVRSFLRQNEDFQLASDWGNWSEHIAPFATEAGLFTSWPHRHGTDGFFASRLVKSNP